MKQNVAEWDRYCLLCRYSSVCLCTVDAVYTRFLLNIVCFYAWGAKDVCTHDEQRSDELVEEGP